MPDPVSGSILGASAIGAGASLYGADKAAKAQKNAANRANDTQLHMFDVLQNNLQPYKGLGQEGVNKIEDLLPYFTTPVTMDQATLEATPGYQFNLTQGLKAVQNSAARRGLGVSGAAEKGAANYATGLADSTYQNQFNNAITNQSNIYNRLLGITGIGENAAAGVGTGALQTGQDIGKNIIGAGNAQAGAYLQGASAISNAAQSVPNALITNRILGMYGNGQNNQIDLGNQMPWLNQ